MNERTINQAKPKRRKTALLLAAIPYTGLLGIDRFYLGYWGLGLLKLATAGGFFIWYIIDIILITTGNLKDKNGNALAEDSSDPAYISAKIKNPETVIRNSPSAEERFLALNALEKSTDEMKRNYRDNAFAAVKRYASGICRDAAMNDPDEKNRLQAAHLTRLYGVTEDMLELLKHTSDQNIRTYFINQLLCESLRRLNRDYFSNRDERSTAEKELYDVLDIYFCDPESIFCAEAVRADLESAAFDAALCITFRKYLLQKAGEKAAGVSAEINEIFISFALQHSFVDVLGAVGTCHLPELHLTEEAVNQLRRKLPEMMYPENGVRILAAAKVPGAERLLQLRLLDSYTDEQKQELSELPEDMIQALLLKGSFHDAGITALHDAPKWTEFVEAHVSRTRTYIEYETIHDQEEDRFYTEEYERTVKRW